MAGRNPTLDVEHSQRVVTEHMVLARSAILQRGQIQPQVNAMTDRQGPSGGVLEHLISCSSHQTNNDHCNLSPTCPKTADANPCGGSSFVVSSPFIPSPVVSLLSGREHFHSQAVHTHHMVPLTQLRGLDLKGQSFRYPILVNVILVCPV